MAVIRDFYADINAEGVCIKRRRDMGQERFETVPGAFCEVAVDPSYVCTVCAEKSVLFARPIPCFNMTGVIE